MKRYYAYKEPYCSRINTTLRVESIHETKLGLAFDLDLMYNIAMSTGLRSKKSRHIKKRFKIVLHQMLGDLLKHYEKEKATNADNT